MENVVVLFGGVSAEYEISLKSASYIIGVLNKMSDKYEVFPVGITRTGAWFFYEGSLEKVSSGEWINDKDKLKPAFISPSREKTSGLVVVENVEEKQFSIKKVDVVIPALHGKNGEDGTVQGLCELAGIPYVGCDVLSSAICMDKVMANCLLTTYNINKPEYIWLRGHDYSVGPEAILKGVTDWIKDKYPVFVKPSCSGSSFGISKVKNKEELKGALERALKYDMKILVERGIDGREIECAVFGEKDDIFVSVLGEIFSFGDFYDYRSKYVNKSKLRLKISLPGDLEFKIKDLAKRAYILLGCSGLARVDFFLEKGTDKIFLNEINTFPGFTEISMYPKLMGESGVAIEKVLEKLIDIAKKKRVVRSATE